MAIVQAMCNSFKQEILTATHNFSAGTHNFKLALYTSSATLGATTTAYSTSQEVTGTGYSAGGGALTSVTPVLDGSTAVCDFNDLTFGSSTITANGALIYNTSAANKAVCVLDFGSDKTATSGTFTIQFPAFTSSAAILRIA